MAARASYIRPGQPDPDEFERLVEMYYEPLYRFAMSLARAESEAADLVQRTFETWAEKGAQLVDRSRIKSWLFTTLHRHFLQDRRTDTRFPHVEMEQVSDDCMAVDPGVIERLEAAELLETLHKVDSQFQAAVSLFYLEDYSYAEIAEILEIPLGTVKSRIARGISQLKKLLIERSELPVEKTERQRRSS